MNILEIDTFLQQIFNWNVEYAIYKCSELMLQSIENKNYHLTKLIVEKYKFDLYYKNKGGQTSLDIALNYTHKKIWQINTLKLIYPYYMNKGVKIQMFNDNNDTFLHAIYPI